MTQLIFTFDCAALVNNVLIDFWDFVFPVYQKTGNL